MTHFINVFLVPALFSSAVYALVATGFNVGVRTTGVFNFAHGNLVTSAPLVVLVITSYLGWPTVLAFVGSFVVVMVIALLAERIAIRPFMHSGHSLPWILSTFGVGIVLTTASALPFSGDPKRFPYHVGLTPWNINGVLLTPVQALTMVTAVVTVLAVSLFYARTSLGRQLEAVAEDLDGAQSIGIDPPRMSMISMAIAAGLAVVTGWLVAPVLGVSPQLGLTITFSGFIAVAVGGVGSIIGGVVGAAVVGFVSQVATVWVGSAATNALLFGCLFLVYMTRPTGLFGTIKARAV